MSGTFTMNDIVTYVHERVQNMTSEEREAKAIPFKRLRKEIFVKYFKLDPNKSSKRAKKKYEKKPTVCRTIKEALEQELLKLFPKRKKKSAGVKSVVKPKEVYKSTAPENVTILSRCGLRQLPSGSVMGRVSVFGDYPVMYTATFLYEEEALIFVDKMKHKHGIPFVARGMSHARPQNVKGSLSMDWPLDVNRNSSELATAQKNGSKDTRNESQRKWREKKKRLANSAATTSSSSAIVNLATSSDDEDDDEDDGNDDPPPKSTKRSRNTSSTSSSTSSKLPPHKQMKLQ
jgi:hypothetical protein